MFFFRWEHNQRVFKKGEQMVNMVHDGEIYDLNICWYGWWLVKKWLQRYPQIGITCCGLFWHTMVFPLRRAIYLLNKHGSKSYIAIMCHHSTMLPKKLSPNHQWQPLTIPFSNRRRPKVSTFGASMKTLGCCPRYPEALWGTVHLM